MEYGKDNNMILIHKKGEPVYSDDREGKILYLEVCSESAILITEARDNLFTIQLKGGIT